MRYLCIDPGFASIGWAIMHIDHAGEICFSGSGGVIRTKKDTRKVLTCDDNMARCKLIASQLIAAVSQAGGWEVFAGIVAESQSWPRNSSASSKVGMAWGILAALAEMADIPIIQVSPQKLKKNLCGSQKASKADVYAAVIEKMPGLKDFWETTGLPNGQKEHFFDAVGAMLAAQNHGIIMAARAALKFKRGSAT